MPELEKPTPKKIVAIVGSTATGKTDFGITLAKRLTTEIISADSQLIYRDLQLGTAKPTLQEQEGVPHHMLDVCAPDESFSAAQYQRQATEHFKRLWSEGKIPVVVGGTGFYLQALLESDFIPDVPPNPAFRDSLNDLSSSELHHRLSAIDPDRASALHPNDRVRILRALEIIDATGKPVPNNNRPKDFSILWLGLQYADRQILDKRIDARIGQMLGNGWLDEVRDLINRFGPKANALNVALGYPELVKVIDGELSLPDAVEQIRIGTRQYARRQMTWFKRNPAIHWLACDELPTLEDRMTEIEPLLDQWLTRKT